MNRKKPSDGKGLSARQLKFVSAYFATSLNYRKALRIAGYSENTKSAEVLDNPRVAAYISKQAKKITDRHEISRERFLAEVCKITFSNISDVVTWDETGLTLKPSVEIDIGALAAVQSITVRSTKYGQSISVKMHDKVRALAKLAEGGPATLRKIYTNVPHHEALPEIVEDEVPDNLGNLLDDEDDDE